jgi:S-adenosylmethionine decarboxylase proenzyme
MKAINPVGEHVLVELNACDVTAINSESLLREGMLRAVALSGATIIKDVFHSFSPHGVTGVIVIAESHVSIHTWPEHGYAAVDIFTCGTHMKVDVIVRELEGLTRALDVSVQKIARGPFCPAFAGVIQNSFSPKKEFPDGK